MIKQLSKELNIQFEKIILSNQILECLNKVVYFLDEPFYSTVSISTFCLSQKASKVVKGVLTGDGSDELIYGYNYIRKALSSKNAYDEYLGGIGWLKNIEHDEILGKSFFTKGDVSQILFSDCEIHNNINETLRRVELFKRLPDYHMMRVDKLTMSFGLEARLPYLRNNYASYTLGIQSHEFINGQDPKRILKKSLKQYLPKTLASTIKRPFNAPIKHWIENDLASDINKVFNNNLLIDRLQLNKKRVNQLLFDYNGDYASVSNVWGVYLLLKWCEIEKNKAI